MSTETNESFEEKLETALNLGLNAINKVHALEDKIKRLEAKDERIQRLKVTNFKALLENMSIISIAIFRNQKDCPKN